MKETSKKVDKAKSKALKDSSPRSSLRTKLKVTDPEIQHFVSALEAENLKFQRQIGKMQAENVTLNNRISILEENTNDRCVHETPPYECLQKAKEQIDTKMKELEKSLRKTR